VLLVVVVRICYKGSPELLNRRNLFQSNTFEENYEIVDSMAFYVLVYTVIIISSKDLRNYKLKAKAVEILEGKTGGEIKEIKEHFNNSNKRN